MKRIQGTMAEAENKPTAEEDLHEDDPNYRAPAQKSVKEIVEADQEDESLRKYKESLLGGAIKEVKPPFPDFNYSLVKDFWWNIVFCVLCLVSVSLGTLL